MEFNQKKINELTSLIKDAQFHLDRLYVENNKLREMINMKTSNGKCIADLTQDELNEIHEAHQNYFNKMENKRYYLLHLNQITDVSNNIKIFEAVYTNGINEIIRTWKYGETINTIIYDNE